MIKNDFDYDLLYNVLYRVVNGSYSVVSIGFEKDDWDWNEFGPTYTSYTSSAPSNSYYLPHSYTAECFTNKKDWEIELKKFRKKRDKVLKSWRTTTRTGGSK